MKKPVTIILIIAGILLILGLNYAFFTGKLLGLSPEVKTALQSDETVTVLEEKGERRLVFQPAGSEPEIGLILYPEGRMDMHTYAYPARLIAEEGYLVVYLSRRAQTDLDLVGENERIQAVMADYPDITTWVVGAHTWGANFASAFASLYPEQVAGVVLWAPRLDPPVDLSDSELPVLAIYGTRDEENTGFLAEVKPLLPAQTEWQMIEGGNRVGFASFGPMAADVGATIPETTQQEMAVQYTLSFLEQIAQ